MVLGMAYEEEEEDTLWESTLDCSGNKIYADKYQPHFLRASVHLCGSLLENSVYLPQ